jgi:hypothetical protein
MLYFCHTCEACSMHEEVKKEKEIWLEILIERAPWET